MKFIASSSELTKAAQLVAGVIAGSSPNPIMENFYMQLAPKKLTITGTDGETTLQTSIQVESEDSGVFTVPSKILLDMLKTFSEQPLTFSVHETFVEIIDETDTFTINLDNPEDYPQLPAVEKTHEVAMPAKVLSEAIAHTLFAVGTDQLRPVMTGVLFQFNEKETRFVSTDAHRLVKYTREDIQSKDAFQFIVPKKPLQLLKNALAGVEESITIEFNEKNARFLLGETSWTTRLIEGEYPKYEAVIPKENPNILTINCDTFLSAIRRASVFSSKSTSAIRLQFKGNLLHISAEDTNFNNKAEMNLPCDYNGEDMQIGFNAKFLIEMLSHVSAEDITLEMSTPNRAGIIRPLDGLEEGEQLLMLVMPVMLNT